MNIWLRSFICILACACLVRAQDLPRPGDVVLGLGNFDANNTIELVRGPLGVNNGMQLDDPWNVNNYIQGVQFDNLGGVLHNARGNLLGVNFGPTVDTMNMTGGGSIYNFATTAPVADGQLLADAWGTGGTITPTEMAGLSVSPDNNRVAVNGWRTQTVIVYDYTAGDTAGGGAALTGAVEIQPRNGIGDLGLIAFDTQQTAWLDNETVLIMSTFGDLFEIDVSTATPTESIVTTVATPFVGSDYASIEYNPDISPYVYAAYSGFAADTVNELYVIDPANDYNLVMTVDLSTSVNTIRDLSFDAAGNLYMISYGGDNMDPGPYIDVLDNTIVTDPTSVADNSTFSYYRSTVDSGFNSLDVGHGTDLVLDGDYDDDGKVAAGDLSLVLSNWGQDASQTGVPDGWINMQPTGLIGASQLSGVLENWGDMLPVPPVPEPSSLVLVLLGLAAFFRHRRQTMMKGTD